MKKFVVVLFSSLLIIACSSTSNNSMPNWFLNQYDSNFTKTNYIVAVGSGDTKEEAEENAMISLSQMFNTSIKNALVTYDNDTTSSMASRGYIDTSVDDLLGVSLVDTFYNRDGVFFVRVALDKSLASNKIREIITPKENEIRSLLKYESNKYIYLKNLIRAQSLALENQKYYDQLSVLQNANVTSSLLEVEDTIAQVKSELSLDVNITSSDNEAVINLKKVIETMLIDSGVLISDNAKAKLDVTYEYSFAPVKDGIYQCNFDLKVQLIENSNTVLSLNETSRGVGISEETAKDRAMQKASSIIEGELFK